MRGDGMRPCYVLFALAVSATMAVGLHGQQPRFNERVDVASVVIDARVIDAFGAPVLGLSAANFFVTVGGKVARVQSSVWTGDSARRVVEPTAAPAAGMVPAAITPPEPGQLVVLLFQKSLVNERVRGYIRMVGQSRELVRGLPASARVAILIFDTSLRAWTDFTTDREAIDRILDDRLLRQRPPKSVPFGSPSLLEHLTPEPRRIHSMERVFQSVADALQPLPGSKAIAFIGYGMGGVPFGTRADGGATHASFGSPGQDLSSIADMNNEFQHAMRSLTAARVSVFSLDITNADSHTLAAGMQTVAAETGGFYASSLDFPERPMRFVAGALKGHYVLFVEAPADPADRSIAVSVTADRQAYVYATSSYSAGK